MKTIATLAGALIGYLLDLRDAFLDELDRDVTYGPLAVLGPIRRNTSDPTFPCPRCGEIMLCCAALADADNHQER